MLLACTEMSLMLHFDTVYVHARCFLIALVFGTVLCSLLALRQFLLSPQHLSDRLPDFL